MAPVGALAWRPRPDFGTPLTRLLPSQGAPPMAPPRTSTWRRRARVGAPPRTFRAPQGAPPTAPLGVLAWRRRAPFGMRAVMRSLVRPSSSFPLRLESRERVHELRNAARGLTLFGEPFRGTASPSTCSCALARPVYKRLVFQALLLSAKQIQWQPAGLHMGRQRHGPSGTWMMHVATVMGRGVTMGRL